MINRVFSIGVDQCFSRRLPLTHSVQDVKKILPYLAKLTNSLFVKPEHLFLATYIRQPQMINNFLGDISLRDLGLRLIGVEVTEGEVERVLEESKQDNSVLLLTSELRTIFVLAEKIARLMHKKSIGCTELFLALLKSNNKELQSLMTDLGIDKKAIQRKFVECNASKHLEPAQVVEEYYSPVSVN